MVGDFRMSSFPSTAVVSFLLPTTHMVSVVKSGSVEDIIKAQETVLWRGRKGAEPCKDTYWSLSQDGHPDAATELGRVIWQGARSAFSRSKVCDLLANKLI